MHNTITVFLIIANMACIVFHPVMPYVLLNAVALTLLVITYEK
jgi:hypothetical protein